MEKERYKELKKEIKQEVLEKINFTKEILDDELLSMIEKVLLEATKNKYISLERRICLKKEVFNSLRRLDILQELLEDNEVTEIMINGPDHIFIERGGTLTKADKNFESTQRLEDVIQQIVAQTNRVVNEASPIVDTRLADGSRINVVLPPVALNGPILTIRRFPKKPITMEDLIEMNSITKEAAEFLKKLVKAKYNIFISGGTGSGKTTFLNVLSNAIPANERIITIEDAAELQIQGINNLVRLEVRNSTSEGVEEISIRDLIKSSLRMRPDRIIVGEVRDAAAIDMLQALNTGHDGSLSTGHANSPKDMLSRLETLVLLGNDIPLLAVRKQIASAIDIIVHLGRLRDKSRRVLQIVEVLELSDNDIETRCLYEFEEEREEEGKIIGALKKTEEKLIRQEKLQRAGIYDY